MKIKFEDIKEAFDFVNSGYYGDHTALLNKSTGQIHWRSESGDLGEIPEALWESENAVEIPHKNDLGLGNQLVFDFVLSNTPDDVEYVRNIFRRRGAYARYKDFLESKGLLQSWYNFENAAQNRVLRKWCKDNGIELSG
ncbi:MAG: hypothetical protein ACOC5F_05290 [Candidatus Aminicenantaceae bacterium]